MDQRNNNSFQDPRYSTPTSHITDIKTGLLTKTLGEVPCMTAHSPCTRWARVTT